MSWPSAMRSGVGLSGSRIGVMCSSIWRWPRHSRRVVIVGGGSEGASLVEADGRGRFLESGQRTRAAGSWRTTQGLVEPATDRVGRHTTIGRSDWPSGYAGRNRPGRRRQRHSRGCARPEAARPLFRAGRHRPPGRRPPRRSRRVNGPAPRTERRYGRNRRRTGRSSASPLRRRVVRGSGCADAPTQGRPSLGSPHPGTLDTIIPRRARPEECSRGVSPRARTSRPRPGRVADLLSSRAIPSCRAAGSERPGDRRERLVVAPYQTPSRHLAGAARVETPDKLLSDRSIDSRNCKPAQINPGLQSRRMVSSRRARPFAASTRVDGGVDFEVGSRCGSQPHAITASVVCKLLGKQPSSAARGSILARRPIRTCRPVDGGKRARRLRAASGQDQGDEGNDDVVAHGSGSIRDLQPGTVVVPLPVPGVFF